MFNRNELLIIKRDVKDKTLLKKINAMVGVDYTIVEILKKKYARFNLIMIEKDDSRNKYHLHFLCGEKESHIDLLCDTMRFANNCNDKENLELELHALEHKKLDSFWHYGGVKAYVREDLLKYIDNKK